MLQHYKYITRTVHYYNCDVSKNCCFNNLVYFADCLLPKKPGPCKAYFPRFYYDTKKKSCQKFIYGGCQGNDNNFKSLEECERKCNTEPEGKVLIVYKCKEFQISFPMIQEVIPFYVLLQENKYMWEEDRCYMWLTSLQQYASYIGVKPKTR